MGKNDDVESDISEVALLRQRAQSLESDVNRLRLSEQELREFLENALEGIHKVGPDGTIHWANKSELELLGYQAEEYIGRHISEFHADQHVIDLMLKQLLDGKDLYNVPARMVCKDGSIKQVLVHSNAYFRDGSCLYSRCFTRDVTALSSSEIDQKRLAAIVDSSDDAIIGKSLDGIITSWNNAAERIFGYTAEEVIGKPKTIVFPPDRLHEEDEILAKLRRGERIDHFETVRRRKNGNLIDVSLTISPIRDGHSIIVGASTIARDITEIKRQQRKLDDLNTRLKRSMTETHHRVKNNLQLMAALIDLQKQSHGDSVPIGEVIQLSRHIQALGVIHDVLTRENKESGDETVISASDVLKQLVPIIQQTLGDRRLIARLEDVKLPGKHTTAVALVANELISNAAKHAPGPIELRLSSDGDSISLEVLDDGPGFPEEFDALIASNIGLELVESITNTDLRGVATYSNREEGGAHVTVKFKLDEPRGNSI